MVSEILTLAQFWPHRTTSSNRISQGNLLAYLTQMHTYALQRRELTGNGTIKLSLMHLRSMVRQYRPAFDFFFDEVQRGYNFPGNRQLSFVSPKDVDYINRDFFFTFDPERRPECGVISKVQITGDKNIVNDMVAAGVIDIIPQVKFLLEGPEFVDFFFSPCGELQLRDTSIWPIRGIEIWPAWLRRRVFGNGGVDIERSFVQFLVGRINLNKFKHIERFWNEPNEVRDKLCQLIGVEYNNHKKLVKSTFMALAMGSRVVASDLTSSRPQSSISSNLIKMNQGVPLSIELSNEITNLLKPLSADFNKAVKMSESTTAAYFKWERDRRYELFNAVGQRGILVHDGIDGLNENAFCMLSKSALSFKFKMER